jgi:hypothetical protein
MLVTQPHQHLIIFRLPNLYLHFKIHRGEGIFPYDYSKWVKLNALSQQQCSLLNIIPLCEPFNRACQKTPLRNKNTFMRKI